VKKTLFGFGLILAILFCFSAADLAESGSKYVKRGFFVYDTVTNEYVDGATVTIYASDGAQVGETGGPHGLVTFLVPAKDAGVDIEVSAVGYADFSGSVTFGAKRGVGVGDWIGIQPN